MSRKSLLEHYEKMAAEARAKADAMKDLEARQMMLRAAEIWDGMVAVEKRRLESG